eukprot:6090185-Amphidinium_carterae.1
MPSVSWAIIRSSIASASSRFACCSRETHAHAKSPIIHPIHRHQQPKVSGACQSFEQHVATSERACVFPSLLEDRTTATCSGGTGR